MVEGNWHCAQCNAPITKLPFTPSEDRLDSLKCLDCFKANKPQQGGERKMYEGSWTCSDCGKEITKMPFEPREGSPVKCLDCFKASR
jgi:CxxC-x17-CxxC domain-containing protein